MGKIGSRTDQEDRNDGIEKPKVSQVVSSVAVTEEEAFDMMSSFLQREKGVFQLLDAKKDAVKLAQSTNKWNNIRRVCNSFLPSNEFDDDEDNDNNGRQPVKAWWGGDGGNEDEEDSDASNATDSNGMSRSHRRPRSNSASGSLLPSNLALARASSVPFAMAPPIKTDNDDDNNADDDGDVNMMDDDEEHTEYSPSNEMQKDGTTHTTTTSSSPPAERDAQAARLAKKHAKRMEKDAKREAKKVKKAAKKEAKKKLKKEKKERQKQQKQQEGIKQEIKE